MKNVRYFVFGFVVCLTFVFTMEYFRGWRPWYNREERAEVMYMVRGMRELIQENHELSKLAYPEVYRKNPELWEK